MSRAWITALTLAVVAWLSYNMMIEGFDISGALLSMGIIGALLALELYEKYQKQKKVHNNWGQSSGYNHDVDYVA